MSPSQDPVAITTEQGQGQALALIGKIARIAACRQPRLVAQMLASLDRQERQALDRLLARLIEGLSSE